MLDFFHRLFSSSDFMPHGHCYFWRPSVLWLHVISDALVALAYFSIPVALFYFARQRRSLTADWMLVMFGIFICACGTTHLLEVITVWYPVYRLAGLVKAVTAVASLATAIALWRLIPRMLAVPNPRQLRESNRRLEREVVSRKAVEEELRRSRDDLEERVHLRTAELQKEVGARQQAETEVRASRQQLQNILDYAPVSIFLKDRAGRYLQANRSFAQTCGYTVDELIGKTSADLFPDEVAAVVESHSEQVFASGVAQEFEEVVQRADGPHFFHSTRFLLPSLDGTHNTLGVISRDVTERKRSEQALEQAREEAERANRAKSEFLSRMSHELRTPLNAILGFGQLLEMGAQNDRQHENVFHILQGGKHLLGLINEVLDIARIESGRLELMLESVPVAQVLAEAVALIRPLAAQRSIRIAPCDGPAVGAFLRADRQRLSQVVLNLLSNAVKYNRQGGSVGLHCSRVADGWLRLAVSDTGPGISVADQSKLFTPFERLGAEHSKVEGTGIGLALCKRLVEAMGGRIGLESVQGQGSTFYLELPIADEEAPSHPADLAEQPMTPPVDGGAGPTVLYIEDNLSNFALVEQALEAKRPNVRLLGAMQGRLGLDMASEHRPTLILLDLQLPDVPGDELLRRLQADEKTRHIPVVMISADATKGQAQRLLALGARGYLTKPLDLRAFLETFDDALVAT